MKSNVRTHTCLARAHTQTHVVRGITSSTHIYWNFLYHAFPTPDPATPNDLRMANSPEKPSPLVAEKKKKQISPVQNNNNQGIENSTHRNPPQTLTRTRVLHVRTFFLRWKPTQPPVLRTKAGVAKCRNKLSSINCCLLVAHGGTYTHSLEGEREREEGEKVLRTANTKDSAALVEFNCSLGGGSLPGSKRT
ncbi:DEAD/DEAH box helicase [Anopheles sinensis]|uniref:DEAD/DEAH box helicase n=1 Tax=Anopheles sinensis TaxID=74873 RepID=A0A084VRM2_ANOSI|nr:DEAD/DEAH box helicase [Anopheles sinensis]